MKDTRLQLFQYQSYSLLLQNNFYYHLHLMKEYLKKTVAEDIDASESIEQMLAIHGDPVREVVKFSDRNTVRGRMLLQKMMEAERLP